MEAMDTRVGQHGDTVETAAGKLWSGSVHARTSSSAVMSASLIFLKLGSCLMVCMSSFTSMKPDLSLSRCAKISRSLAPVDKNSGKPLGLSYR
jgi:hypothetical protein